MENKSYVLDCSLAATELWINDVCMLFSLILVIIKSKQKSNESDYQQAHNQVVV